MATLQKILLAREARAQQQKELLTKYRCPVVSFTMNIPGPEKVSPEILRAFRWGCKALESCLEQVRFQQVTTPDTGCQALYAVAMDSHALKDLCCRIEDSLPLGRLFDMDVLTPEGNALNRGVQRGCMVCGAPGRFCAASRAHSVEQLQAVTQRLLRQHFAPLDAGRIAVAVVQSLLEEVSITPKPGLVDQRNTGSHKDMDIATFVASARALEPYFAECVRIGQDTAHLPPEETFPPLRRAGLLAEDAMYRATGGVNTHKGAIYTLGILCGSMGRLWSVGDPIPAVGPILKQCAQITAPSLQRDLEASTPDTAGLRLYRRLGLTGIRGEVANGLPSVASVGLPVYRNALALGFSTNDAGVYTLLHLISQVADTNLYHRGGEDGAAFAAASAKKLLRDQRFPSMDQIEALDDAFIARNLSPGGCADLLAATVFLANLSWITD